MFGVIVIFGAKTSNEGREGVDDYSFPVFARADNRGYLVNEILGTLQANGKQNAFLCCVGQVKSFLVIFKRSEASGALKVVIKIAIGAIIAVKTIPLQLFCAV